MKKSIQEKLLGIVKRNYSEIAEAFDISRKKYIWPEIKKITQDILPGAKVLDAGCGNGRLLEAIGDKGIKYTGFDSSSELVSLAKKNYPNNNFFVMDILEVEKLKDKYDIIFSIAVLSHIPGRKERIKLLQSLAGKLNEGGKLAISVWDIYNQDKFRSIIILSELKRIFLLNGLEKGDLIFFWKNEVGQKVSKRYYHAFSDKEISNLISSSGLELEEIIKDGKNIWLVLINK